MKKKKKYLVVFIIISIIIYALFSYSKKEHFNLETQENKHSELEIQENKFLELKDFTIKYKDSTISLDNDYFDKLLPFNEIDTNYVGEVQKGEYTYKYYFHNFEHLDIYTSNYKYNVRNSNFDKYYISQIVIKSPLLKTFRGLSVGMSLNDIFNKYGKPNKKEENVIEYKLVNKELTYILSFNLDKKIIKEIVMRVD